MLTVKPSAGRAVLFYSQNADGSKDVLSLHGACPVLTGDKWAGKLIKKPKYLQRMRHSLILPRCCCFTANLWVWNTPRQGFKGSPRKKKEEL